MKVEELDYTLPCELIAREPREIRGEKRSDSKLLVMNRETQKIDIKRFEDILEYFNEGDVLVLNDSKTINAYLIGKFANDKKVELQLCGRSEEKKWYCYIPLDNTLYEGGTINFQDKLTGHLVEKCTERLWLAEFEQENVVEMANEVGKAVNSHYMSKQWGLEYYQNVFGNVNGSSELPAAGRHFSKQLLEKIERKGVSLAFVTLHTGLSSIIVEEENFEKHIMHSEEISISSQNADLINEKKRAGGKVWAVGTTVVRALETVANEEGEVKSFSGFTNLYIYPGYNFKIVNAFITNFHGPRSTRIAMAAAFTGKELLKKGYEQAIKNNFRFFEFGDATLTL